MMHLLTLESWPVERVRQVLDLAKAIKARPIDYARALERKTLFMIFEKPSLRTRVSFETGMTQLGGHAIYYDMGTSPSGAGKETIADTVRTVSRYVDLIMARLFEHEKLVEMAAYAGVPVINALTDFSHPCQVLADLLTIEEKKGDLKGRTLAYFGDANNNVTHSLMYGCAMTGMHMRVGCPDDIEYAPQPEVVASARALADAQGGSVQVMSDPAKAARDADVVYTDSWMSYHIPKEKQDERVAALQPYQVNETLMKQADEQAIFMNCLPAQRGAEQTGGVIDGPQSVVFDEAENRLHAQKAVMLLVTGALPAARTA